MGTLYKISLNSQYHSNMEFYTNSMEGAFNYIDNEFTDCDIDYFKEAVRGAWVAGVNTHRTGNNKYTAMVESIEVWM